ncbi:glycine--tRNA ligase subunit beta [Pseudoduganella plicata]|uniref:Glycine--tRNA ligase beta subunit n=1 Tax=Pseudoduganella plicata TaxID=321984 RepID=A0A4P7BEW2_9BURK|nr:glycine--tRNA ligase subunit beta [Pseudoduganella plicata]QBQ36810.1 glycine--tRNA ligase subunit beta [Pseudoduganella plicata]GGY72534.1 glycine--tRNA ligase beta subunit [Pseudoduganella plicata]
MTQTLLIELLTEELPPKALSKLGTAFAAGIVGGLKSRDFLADDSVATTYATPRRLAVSITNVRDVSPDKSIREKVLPVTVALDKEGNPTAPLAKKLAALGFPDLQVADLERAQDGKAESFFYTYTAPGSPLQTGLQTALEESVAKLPIPKVMSYQRPDGATVQFVRPAHSLIALYGDKVLPLTLLGLTAANVTDGHRFLTAPGQRAVTVPHADAYATTLIEQAKVIPSFDARKEQIRTALLEKAGADQVLMPEALLEEVTSLVEWPVVYECRFEEEFLAVPQECLILTMQTNQKYFALTDTDGKLRSRFLIVSNIATDTPQAIIGGNERVVRPRLSDAKFFFEQDKKKTLASRIDQLRNVVYHNKLGTQYERTDRVMALAGNIAERIGADQTLAERAALLAKADLLTDMVGEFPELQGIMGTYYARHDKEEEEVALAISEHYQPRFAGDALPTTASGTVVALADKLETLVGIWSIGLQPTGDKDPFALRRHALGVLRMMIEKRLPVALSKLLEDAVSSFTGRPGFVDPRADVTTFMMDRLRGILREKGFTPNEIEAVVAQNPDRLDDIVQRLEAVQAFAALPESSSLAAANKRITNILKKNEEALAQAGTVNPALLQDTAEKNLAAAVTRVQPQVDAAFAAGDFTGTLKTLAQLRDDVDAFFNDVMVMAEDIGLRNNRLALLSSLHGMMNRVADISKLAA